MPTYPIDIQDKLDALQALTGAERKPAELVVVYWPTPTGTKVYSSAMYTELPWWPDLAAAIESYFGDPIPITLTLIPHNTPFIDLPRAASISDDSINLTFDDTDDAFSGLLMTYGEGIRAEVFCYWPTVDLLLSMWRGMLHQPKDMNRDQVKITATSGWRAPQMLVPKRPFATSCPFIFGAFYDTQEAIDQAKGCPYNAHLTEIERGDAPLIGVPGFTDCPRRVKADCFARLTLPDSATQTETFWPGFETREDPIPNNQTQGPNLLAKAIGNESALSDPIRVIFGERHVKALYLLAFRNELNTNHPDEGFGAALFAVSEGSNLAMWEFRINGQLVGAEHFQLRLGALGQLPTDWSPDVNSYSGTAHGYGRILGDFTNATASDYSGSMRVLGNNEVRVYSNPSTYIEGYTTNRAWCLLHTLAHLRWGYGQDYPRFDIQSWMDAAVWCDEYVTLTDANGNTFSGVRSTFNAEVTARAIQQQVKDICTAGRLGIPFEFEGKDVIVPLKAEDLDDPLIPTFSDEGPTRNIVYDGAKSSLSWSVISDESMTNQWTVNFDDAANGGVDTQFIFGDQAQQLRAGRAWGDRSKRVVNKSQAGYGINSAQEAARFGNSLLYLGPLDSGGILNPFSVKFTTWYSEAFNVQNYKLIKVVNAKLQSRMAAYFTARGLEPYPDADFTYFRVMKYTRKGDLRVEIEAQQYATLDIALSDPPALTPEYVYFCDQFGGDNGPVIGRIPKADFQASAIESFEITLPAGLMNSNFGAMAVDEEYVYTCNSFPTHVHRFSKSSWGDYDYVQIGTVSPDETDASGSICESAIVVDGSYIYCGFTDPNPHSHIIRVHRLHKSDFSTQDILTVVSPGGGNFSIAQDDGALYLIDMGRFSSPTTNDKAIKVDKSSFTVVGTVDLGNKQVIVNALSIAVDASLAYVASDNIYTINKASWASATTNNIGHVLRAVLIDENSNNLWVSVFGIGPAPNLRVYDRTTFSEVQTITLSTNAAVTRIYQDDTYVYAMQPEASPNPTLTRISKADYSQTVVLLAFDFTYAMAVDPTGGGVATGFGPPRDFTAEVNSITGQVQFAWAPPLLHPELVIGYEMRDSFGNLVMPEDLVLAFETTLAPGTYSYKVRATDGTVWSGYAIVTFTVPSPPVDPGLIDRDTGNTMVDRTSGDVLESRIG